MTKFKIFSEEEAKEIGQKIGINFSVVNVEEFRKGLTVELEHGVHDPETDVTGGDVYLTGKIAWAHIKELPDYYTRLIKMEGEAEAELKQ